MVKIVIIEKGGDCKDSSLKSVNIESIYKKCGFRKPDHFDKRHKWKISYGGNKLIIVVYAKNNGRANSENKFDFPPPIDNELYFGNIALVAYKNSTSEENAVDFSVNEWCKVYEKLMGGFEDLTKTSPEESEEEENIPKEELTKQGYHKDGFIVDSEEELEEEEITGGVKESAEESEEETEEEEEEEEELENMYKEEGSEESSGQSETEIEEEEEEELIGSELSEEEYVTESETEY